MTEDEYSRQIMEFYRLDILIQRVPESWNLPTQDSDKTGEILDEKYHNLVELADIVYNE